jgi:hypothetical protein
VITDLRDYSCNNGWTAGNLAASADNLASFFYDVFTHIEPSGRHPRRDDDEDDLTEDDSTTASTNVGRPGAGAGAHAATGDDAGAGDEKQRSTQDDDDPPPQRQGFLTRESLQAMTTNMVPNIVLGGLDYGLGFYNNTVDA